MEGARGLDELRIIHDEPHAFPARVHGLLDALRVRRQRRSTQRPRLQNTTEEP